MMRRAWLAPLACAALAGAGCGGGGEAGGGETESGETLTAAIAAAAPRAAPEPPTGARLEVVDSQFGRVVAHHQGEALYLFDRQEPLLRDLRPGLAAALDEGQAGRGGGRSGAARHHPAVRRRPAGDLRRPPALLLHRRLPRHDPLPRCPRVRGHVAGGDAGGPARLIGRLPRACLPRALVARSTGD